MYMTNILRVQDIYNTGNFLMNSDIFLQICFIRLATGKLAFRLLAECHLQLTNNTLHVL